MRHETDVAVIGSGFSAVALALNLVELAPPTAKISLVGARKRQGRGIAYAATADCHLLNVPAGLPTYRYSLTYELREPAANPIALRWNEGDFHLTYDGATLEGTRRITAERTFPTADPDRATYPTATGRHALTLEYTEAPTPTLNLQSPCVERTTTSTECILPQGDPTTDTINGITCRDCVWPPARTVIHAPMASRFAFVPTSLNRAQ